MLNVLSLVTEEQLSGFNGSGVLLVISLQGKKKRGIFLLNHNTKITECCSQFYVFFILFFFKLFFLELPRFRVLRIHGCGLLTEFCFLSVF